MNNLSITDIDPDMACIADKISRLGLGIGYLPASRALLRRASWKRIPEMPVNSLYKSGAVCTIGQAGSSKYIGVPHKLKSVICDRTAFRCSAIALGCRWTGVLVVGIRGLGFRAGVCRSLPSGLFLRLFPGFFGCLLPGLLFFCLADLLILLCYRLGISSRILLSLCKLAVKIRYFFFSSWRSEFQVRTAVPYTLTP